jgi:hypothetical protein
VLTESDKNTVISLSAAEETTNKDGGVGVEKFCKLATDQSCWKERAKKMLPLLCRVLLQSLSGL